MKPNVILLLALATMLAGCAGWAARRDAATTLRQNTAMWRAFRLEGLATIESKGMSLHSEVVLRKNDGKLRIDVLDKGLFAAGGSPMAIIYVDTLVVAKIWGQTDVEPLTEDYRLLCLPGELLDSFASDHLQEIVNTRAVALNETFTVHFDKAYRLSGLSFADGTAANVTYTPAGKLATLEIISKENDRLLIEIDDFTPGPVDVPPLPLP